VPGSLLKPVVDGAALVKLKQDLKLIDEKLHLQVSKEITGYLRPIAKTMAGGLPQQAPIRGFGRSGNSARWSGVKGQAYSSAFAKPGKATSIARIELFGGGKDLAAFKIADLAGTKGQYGDGALSKAGPSGRQHTVNGQGRAMVEALSQKYPLSAGGRGGRFGWASFMKSRPEIIRRTIEILNSFADRVAREMSS
jgi:hypothetical protein